MSLPTYRLSLFDKSPVHDGASGVEALAASVAFAQEAEALGYHRVWLAEHHGAPPLAGSAPEILAAFILAKTSRIRVGSGGVLLQHYSPFKVAEQFRVLAALAPDRVDLGIGKAPGGLPFTTKALQADRAPDAAGFEAKLNDLTAFLRGGVAEAHPLHGARAYPEGGAEPELFLLGGSTESAEIAARTGWNFSFAGHFDGGDDYIRAGFDTYRQAAHRAPSLAVTAIIAPTQAIADARAAKQTIYRVHLPDGRNVNLPNEDAAKEYARQAGFTEYRLEERHPRILAGTAQVVRAELDRLASLFGIEEFFIDIPATDPAERLSSIRLLAGQQAQLAAAE